MVYINDRVCNGCGECIDICPTSALIFQNNRAFINQDLCQGCEVCLDACPRGAILSGEWVPVTQEMIRVPDMGPEPFPFQLEPAAQMGLRDMVLPAIGSLLLWTGRELVPRLADAALGYLDQRMQSSQSPVLQKLEARGAGRASKPTRWSGRGQRRRRHRRNRRFV